IRSRGDPAPAGAARHRMNRARALFAIAACLTGCAAPPDRPDPNSIQPAPVALPPARVVPSPAAVAVFYSPGFTRQQVADRAMPSLSHRPGPASVALFDRVLEAAFGQVVRLPAWPSDPGKRPEVALVFVPRVAGIATVQTPGSTARLVDYTIEA